MNKLDKFLYKNLSPKIGKIMTKNELRQWNKEISTNGVNKRCIELNCNIFNFTALVGIPLSDQIKNGDGNVGVLKGAHHKMENFFKMQFKAGGPIGPDGPGWQRENTSAPNGHGLNHYPDSVRESFKRNAVRTSDGMLWPKANIDSSKTRRRNLNTFHIATFCYKSCRSRSQNDALL